MPFDGAGFYPWEDQPEPAAPVSESHIFTAVLAVLLGVVPLIIVIAIDITRCINGADVPMAILGAF